MVEGRTELIENLPSQDGNFRGRGTKKINSFLSVRVRNYFVRVCSGTGHGNYILDSAEVFLRPGDFEISGLKAPKHDPMLCHEALVNQVVLNDEKKQMETDNSGGLKSPLGGSGFTRTYGYARSGVFGGRQGCSPNRSFANA